MPTRKERCKPKREHKKKQISRKEVRVETRTEPFADEREQEYLAINSVAHLGQRFRIRKRENSCIVTIP